MAKPNYRHAKKQKEAARKARQDAKQQRKNAPDAVDAAQATHAPGARADIDGPGTIAVEAPAGGAPAVSDV